MASFEALLREVRGAIAEVEPVMAFGELAARSGDARVPLHVIDVREPDETADGTIAGALLIPRGYLELRIERTIDDRAAPILLYCAGGTRSALAARSLGELGYTNVRAISGGFTAWKQAGLPWTQAAGLRADQQARYARHTMLAEVGEAGQLKLLAAKIACVGAGGLGSPAAMYLAAAGVGTLGVIDDDVVDASNLQRQILHGTDRVGRRKVDSAADTIARLNPDVRVERHAVRLTAANARALLAPYDVVIDGTDNFTTRYVVNDAALALGKPVVHASIFRFEGQLTAFAAAGAPCYRCLFPSAPPPELAPSCAQAGVLGVLPGVLGVLQATEAIKLVLGIGAPLFGRLVVYDALAASFRELAVRRDPNCPACGAGRAPDTLQS